MGCWSGKNQLREVCITCGKVCLRLIKGRLANHEKMVARQPFRLFRENTLREITLRNQLECPVSLKEDSFTFAVCRDTVDVRLG